MTRGTSSTKGRTILGLTNPLQNQAANAVARCDGGWGGICHQPFVAHIKLSKVRLEAESAGRNFTDAPPNLRHDLKNLVHQRLSHLVARFAY